MSIVQTLRERFTKTQRAKKTVTQSEYDQLIADLYEGNERDPESIQSVLDAADRSWEQLDSDVAEVPKKIKRVEQVRKGDAAAQRLKVLEPTIEQLLVELDEVCKPIQAKLAAARAEYKECEQLITTANAAKRQLVESCSPTIKDRESEIESELKKLLADQSAISNRMPNPLNEKHLLDEIAKRKRTLSHMGDAHSTVGRDFEQRQIDDAEWALQNYNSRKSECESQLTEVRSKIRELQSEQSALNAKKLGA